VREREGRTIVIVFGESHAVILLEETKI
jgi:hypothetical protein